MIVPVQPKSVEARMTSVESGLSSVAAGREWRDGPTLPENISPPSIRIGSLVVESTTPISTTAIRDGFREAWLRHDHSASTWSPETYRHGLSIEFPPGATGRELGRRLAEAILQRARVP